MSDFRYIDLFAGIGGMRIPFDSKDLGGRCVFTSEKDAKARETYRGYFVDKEHLFNDDITLYYGSEGEKDRFHEIPDHELLLAGFPCQPFSLAGKRLGSSDERALYHAIHCTVAAKKPRVVLLENVRGLRSVDGGKTFSEILSSLESLGYVAKHDVLNARDFGLPQNRNRLFIVAIRKDVPNASDFTFPEPTHDRNSLRVGDFLDCEPDPSLTISDRLWAGHKVRKERNLLNNKGFGFQAVTKESMYTATISARYYKDGSEILVRQDGKNPRKISVAEAARLQGFPSDFKFPESKMQAYKQLGNAVPVAVIRALAAKLKPYLAE